MTRDAITALASIAEWLEMEARVFDDHGSHHSRECARRLRTLLPQIEAYGLAVAQQTRLQIAQEVDLFRKNDPALIDALVEAIRQQGASPKETA